MRNNDVFWNAWHGCIKKSEGCKYCYVYRRDEKYELDSMKIYKTQSFDLPIKKKRNGEYKIPSGSFVWTCFTSDFLLEEADGWRETAWDMIRERQDLHFLFITKRIERFSINLPDDWGDGWDNVTVCCTCENQRRADERLPVFLSLPIKHRQIVCEPLLEKMDISEYLTDQIESVSVGGESGPWARECDFEWILSLREQCVSNNIPFKFHQTGANFIKDGKRFHIERKYQFSQAKRANIDYFGE